jgi:hypothetical protein
MKSQPVKASVGQFFTATIEAIEANNVHTLLLPTFSALFAPLPH